MASPSMRAFEIIQEAGADQESLSFPGTPAFLDLLESLACPQNGVEGVDADELGAARGLFDWKAGGSDDADVCVARAPGRLDVMGGIADYSGSLVLQLPLAEACHAAAQLLPADGQRPCLRIVSLGGHEAHRSSVFSVPMDDLFGGDTSIGSFLGLESVREVVVRRDADAAWATYPVACLAALAAEHPEAVAPLRTRSLALLVASRVPEGKGVSSSAALEIACARALAAALPAPATPTDGVGLALLCQAAENRGVGAPCGVMDQMASCLGRRGELLALLCQPCQLKPGVPLPDHLAFWGIDSGERHSVGGSDYGAVRTGAFMGLKILRGLGLSSSSFPLTPDVVGKRNFGAHAESSSKKPDTAQHQAEGSIPSRSACWPSCPAAVAPSQWAGGLADCLPEHMNGAAFLKTHGPHADAVTEVNPEQMYAVRGPAAHPVAEHLRVRAFAQTLAAPAGDEQLELLGELMRGSHASYGAIGLGSPGTDRIVALVERERANASPNSGESSVQGSDKPDSASRRRPVLHGAKITGGGSGGVVCVLATAGPEGKAAVHRVAAAYAAERGWPEPARVFAGSSHGAQRFGILRLRR